MKRKIEITHNEVKQIIAAFFGADPSEVRFEFATKYDSMDNMCAVIEQKHINILVEKDDDSTMQVGVRT